MEPTEKNKGKKSLWMRLKPVAIADSVLPAMMMPKPQSSDPVLAYLSVADKDGAVFPSMVASMFEAAAPSDDCGGRRKKGKNRWHALRAVLNGTTLMRKVISRRKANKENLSMSRSTTNLEEISPNIPIPKCKITQRTTSTVSSASITNSSSSLYTSAASSPARTDQVSISSSPMHETYSSVSSTPLNNGTSATKQNQCGIEEKKKGHNGSKFAYYCMLSICLLVLVMWGRLPSIMCTSIWFYIVHPRRTKPCNEGGLIGESEVGNSVQNKSKIVVERKPERTRSRVSFGSNGVNVKVIGGARNLRESEKFLH